VQAEMVSGRSPDPDLAQNIAAALRTAIRASAEITLLPHGTLPLSEGKSRRVLRSYRP